MAKHEALNYLIYSICCGIYGKTLQDLNLKPDSFVFWCIAGPMAIIGFIWLDPLELFKEKKK